MVKIAASEHLKQVTGRLFTISKYNSKEETLFWMFFTKRKLKIVKTIGAHSKKHCSDF